MEEYEQSKRVRGLTDEGIYQTMLTILLLASKPHPTWYTRVLLSLTTGLRKNDIESLRIADIDFEIDAIDTGSKKTRKSMLFRPLPPKITDYLAAYVGSLPAGQVNLFSDTHTHKKWKKIRTRAGLPDLRYQDLRVTFSSFLAEAGESTSVRQRLLEHSSPQITEDYYTKVQDPILHNAVNKLPVDEWL